MITDKPLDFINRTLDIKDSPDFKVVSTFSGCGGSSTGYVWAGGKVLLAIEWDKNAVETYRLNYPDTDIYHGDIAKISVQDVLDRTGLEVGELDILDGSPPCQGFSTAGKRNLDDDRNQLFREYVRLLRGLKPKVFVMENVSGMVKGKMKLLFAEILRELKASGYKVSAKLLNAMYLGVPQSRQRMIFIGVRDDLGIAPSHPKPQTRAISIAETLDISNDGKLVYRHSYSKGCVKFGASGFDKPALTIRKASSYSVVRYGDTIANIDKPIGTITKLSRWFIDDKNEFSLEAYQRLSSFPDCYKFTSFNQGKLRIGNSVPPEMMRRIALHIKENILDKID